MVAIAVIIGSAASVIDKDYAPRLAVEVTGVPGYIYYDRAYDLSIEYANLGGPIDGPVELTVDLPETFALAEHVADPARRGERLTWTLDGLGAGERGSLPIAVQGVLPDDLTNAVYDLPGYAGHTAFVEGFDLGVTLTAGDASASTLAVADTGDVLTRTLTIIKDCGGLTPAETANQEFTWSFVPTTQDPAPPVLDPLLCGEQQQRTFPDLGYLYTLIENVPEDWTLSFDYEVDCALTNIGALEDEIVDEDVVGFQFATGTNNDSIVTCTFTNTPDPAALIIVKVCDPNEVAALSFTIDIDPRFMTVSWANPTTRFSTVSSSGSARACPSTRLSSTPSAKRRLASTTRRPTTVTAWTRKTVQRR
jgi:hypothetical protein